jgi:hypothetical protein
MIAESEMDMPTPCECGTVLELNDMNTCSECRQLFCHECCEPWGTCINCIDKLVNEDQDND